MSAPAQQERPEPGAGGIEVQLAGHLERVGLSMAEVARRVGITPENLGVLKNGNARAVRFTTLAALCHVLGCQPGDLLVYRPPRPGGGAAQAPVDSAPAPRR